MQVVDNLRYVTKNSNGCLLAMSLLLLCWNCKVPEEQQPVIATVGDEHLSLSEVIDEIPPHMRPRVNSSDIKEYVLRWVNNEVLYQEALGRKIDQNPDLKKQFERVKKELIINSLIQQTLNNQVVVSDEEVKAYYDSNQEEFTLSEDMVHAYHILVQTKGAANAIRSRLKKGESFEEIAKESSSDSLNGGSWDLGYFSKSEIIPEISKVVFNIPNGNYSFPIKSEFGYHIVKVLDKIKKGDTRKLAQVQEEIRRKLTELKRQANYQRFLLQTKSKFTVTTNFQILSSVVLDSLVQNGEKAN